MDSSDHYRFVFNNQLRLQSLDEYKLVIYVI